MTSGLGSSSRLSYWSCSAARFTAVPIRNGRSSSSASRHLPLEGLFERSLVLARRCTVLSRRRVASRPSSRRVATWLSKNGPVDEAPADAGASGRPRAEPSARAAALNGRAEPGPDGARSLRVERVAVGRADRLDDGALDPSLGPEADLAQIGVVDVPGEDRDRGRRAAPLARADLLEQFAEAVEGESGRRPNGRSRPLAAASLRPGRPSFPSAPSQTRSFQASSWWKPGESRYGTVVRDHQVVEVAVAVLDDPVPHLVVEHRAPLLGQHPRGSGVHEDRPDSVDVATVGPAGAGRGRVDLVPPSRRSVSAGFLVAAHLRVDLVSRRARVGERLPICW